MRKIATLLLAALMLLGMTACGPADPTEDICIAADNFITVITDRVSLVSALAPEEFWDEMNREVWTIPSDTGYYGSTVCDAEEYYEYRAGKIQETLTEYYGEYEITYEVTKFEEVTQRKMEDLIDALDESYDIDEDQIGMAYKVTVEWEVEGDKRDDDGKFKSYAVYINNVLYIVDLGVKNGDDIAVFPALEYLRSGNANILG